MEGNAQATRGSGSVRVSYSRKDRGLGIIPNFMFIPLKSQLSKVHIEIQTYLMFLPTLDSQFRFEVWGFEVECMKSPL